MIMPIKVHCGPMRRELRHGQIFSLTLTNSFMKPRASVCVVGKYGTKIPGMPLGVNWVAANWAGFAAISNASVSSINTFH